MSGIARAIAERPELEMALSSLEDVTLGQLYRTMFPEGVLKMINIDAIIHNPISAYDELNDVVSFHDDDHIQDLSHDSRIQTNLVKSQLGSEISESAVTKSNENSTSLPTPITDVTPTQSPESSEVTAKVNQLPLHTIFAENEIARITRSTTLPQSVDLIGPPVAAEYHSSTSSDGNPNPPTIRPNLVGFDSREAGTKLREWLNAYFAG